MKYSSFLIGGELIIEDGYFPFIRALWAVCATILLRGWIGLLFWAYANGISSRVELFYWACPLISS